MFSRRMFGAGLGAALGAVWLGETLFAQGIPYDAVVAHSGRILPGLSGTGHGPVLRTIGEALALARNSKKWPFRILLGPGFWHERLVIDRPGIALFGSGAHRTVISEGAYAGMTGADGKPVGTFGTASVTVTAPDFYVRRLTISNSFDYDHAPREILGNGAQAVALALREKADRCFLDEVVISGHQDTLLVDSGRSLFRKCRILGCIDFIFGAGRAFFEDSHIVSLNRPGADFNGYIAAPDTHVDQPVGLVFSHCHLHKGIDVAPRSVALGRPWRHSVHFPDGTYGNPEDLGACAYLHCWMDDHILPEGWRPMGYRKKGGGRGMLHPQDARFFEYGSFGPGAGVPTPTRRMLTQADLARFSKSEVLKGWQI